MQSKLRKGDFVMHRGEGWYGVVTYFRGNDEKGEIYQVRILDPKEYYRLEDLQQVSVDEVPFHVLQRSP